MVHRCDNCPSVEILKEKLMFSNELEMINEISYKQWMKTDGAELKTIITSVDEFVENLDAKLSTLCTHHFFTKAQSGLLSSRIVSQGISHVKQLSLASPRSEIQRRDLCTNVRPTRSHCPVAEPRGKKESSGFYGKTNLPLVSLSAHPRMLLEQISRCRQPYRLEGKFHCSCGLRARWITSWSEISIRYFAYLILASLCIEKQLATRKIPVGGKQPGLNRVIATFIGSRIMAFSDGEGFSFGIQPCLISVTPPLPTVEKNQTPPPWVSGSRETPKPVEKTQRSRVVMVLLMVHWGLHP
ncbi:hypothetical protein AVEN_9821-1 [Araneus ventricosus]|uniref:Uncharacterized protein n=1 Tax=Araneus ventricosus TaxID=182803 RepID=A0A4Y2ESD8_ARAVE|nr:hypothetical protein AVEN_9821-1 [Araneus ventricosus]